ncbi:hypothetical protein AB6852_10410 [Carnobacterium divergens]|nr:hypothetical protein [Carnobacterium divergens]MDT1997423.1 hypothetical protein [Carnobacterium divergens]
MQPIRNKGIKEVLIVKKKWWWVFSLVIILILGIGGGYYMNKNQERNEQQQLLNAEKKIAVFIVQNYDPVSQIDFGKASYSKNTGSWSVNVEINKNKNNLIAFNFDISKNETFITSTSYDSEHFTLTKKTDSTKSIEKTTVNYGGIK